LGQVHGACARRRAFRITASASASNAT
jgi:hypothetical protein